MPTETLFFPDDACAAKNKPDFIALIDSTHEDVSTHEPYPLARFGKVKKHKKVSRAVYRKFMQDGIPPKGITLVEWIESNEAELLPEKELKLLDRPLLVGDVVRRSQQDPMCGTVLRTTRTCELRGIGEVQDRKSGRMLHANWYRLNRDEQSPFNVTEGEIIRGVPASELKYVHHYNEGDIVIYKNWIGRIRDFQDEVTVRLLDGTVVVPKDELELEPYDPLVTDRFNIGDLITTRKANLRTGRWVYGSYNPNLQPIGTVVNIRTVEIEVDWLQVKLGSSSTEPEEVLGLDELESGDVVLYDRTRRAQNMTPEMQETLTVNDIEVVHGLRVQFRDLAGASVKYDGTTSQGKINRIDRKTTLGYDMNTFVVTSFSRDAVVQWQDQSITTERSIDLIPEIPEEVMTLFPDQIVCSQSHSNNAETAFFVQPDQVGIVDTVDAKDRIAQIRWCPDTKLRMINEHEHLTHGHISQPADESESVSLYDVVAPLSLNLHRGDLVFTQEALINNIHGMTSDFDWLGEIVDIGAGCYTICMGAGSEVKLKQGAATDVVLAIRADDDWDDEAWGGEDGDDDEDDDDDEYADYASDSEEHDANELVDGLSAAEERDMARLMQSEALHHVQGVLDAQMDDAEDTQDSEWSTEDEDAYEDAPETAQPETNGHGTDKQSDTFDPTSPAQISEAQGDEPNRANDLQISPASDGLASYLLLESDVPSTHEYSDETPPTSAKQLRSMMKEHEILRQISNLPEGVYVRSWESRVDLLRILIVGPVDTPYALAPFAFDIVMPVEYPQKPPKVFFHHWDAAGGPSQGRVNPNLYEDGTVCLSLLGTWSGDESNGESWIPGKSTILQVIVSLLGLVLVREPYYNEAGYEAKHGSLTAHLPSVLYNERTQLMTRAFLMYAVEGVSKGGDQVPSGLEGLEDVVRWLYASGSGPQLLQRAITVGCEVIARSESPTTSGEERRDGVQVMSKGACISLKRLLEKMALLKQSP